MKKTVKILVVVLFLLVGAFYIFLYPRFEIVAGFNAKILCSCMFVTGLSQEEAERIDLGFSQLWLATNEVDTASKTVKSSVWGFHPKKAVYREGLGCTLIHGEDDDLTRAQRIDKSKIDYGEDIWPVHTVHPVGHLREALEAAFDPPGSDTLKTRAVLVAKHGRIIGEMYAEGIDKDTPLLGWSMMKSVNAAAVGLLLRDGTWQLDDPAPVSGWQGDERRDITLRHLLQMTSGLDWEEDYGKVSAATKMLYARSQMGAYAAEAKLAHPPGTEWYYSSGTSNILSMIMAGAFDDMDAYQRFYHERLFGPLGMRSFIAETDASGHVVGSSYGYATARDWAKFGHLFLNEGDWYGTQILDSSFVEFCRTPVPQSDGDYGGQFWTNGGNEFPQYSPNAYWLSGFQGQQVSIHPDEGLVVVRIGNTYNRGDFDFDTWMGKVLKAAERVRITKPRPAAHTEETEGPES